jgi:hypothetical protein
MLDTQNIEYLDALSQTYKELDKLKEVKSCREQRPEARHLQFKDCR